MAKAAHQSMFMTAEEFQRMTGLGRSGAYNALRRGEVPGAFQLGQRWLIPRAAFEQLARGQLSLFDPDEK